MDKVIKMNNNDFKNLLSEKKEIGFGSEGTIFEIGKDFVLKQFNEFADMNDYSEEELLQFSDIDSSSYYFTKKIIYVDEELEALIMKKCNGYNLTSIKPLTINLTKLLKAYEKFDKDTKAISEKNIKGFDMMFNFMYDGNLFGAIDTIHYFRSDDDTVKIYEDNISTFNHELTLLLIDGNFNTFVNSIPQLKEMYEYLLNHKDVNFKLFISKFKEELRKYCDKDIILLEDAKKAIRKTDSTYPNFPKYSLKQKQS